MTPEVYVLIMSNIHQSEVETLAASFDIETLEKIRDDLLSGESYLFGENKDLRDGTYFEIRSVPLLGAAAEEKVA